MTKISQDLSALALPIEDLVPLDNNPRRGNVDAIMASYEQFGQLKPIVVRPNDDGTYTVIAGNHQLEAARRLGWNEIAAVQMRASNQTAIAFALADNRTMELGFSDQNIINDIVVDLYEDFPSLFDGLGWDEFEIAAIEESQISTDAISPISDGYVTPVLQSNPKESIAFSVEQDEDGTRRIVAGSDVDHSRVAVSGSTVASPGSSPQAVVQYTIVFDNPEQQRRWYEFVRWLRNDPAIVGETTAEKLIDFIDQHVEI